MAVSPATVHTVLTKEQLARFNMPYQEVLREHWKQIPEVVEKAPKSSDSNLISSISTGVSDFFGNIGSFLSDTFASFGLGIQETIITLLIVYVFLVALYCVLKMLLCRRPSKKRTPKDSCSHKCKCGAGGNLKV